MLVNDCVRAISIIVVYHNRKEVDSLFVDSIKVYKDSF